MLSRSTRVELGCRFAIRALLLNEDTLLQVRNFFPCTANFLMAVSPAVLAHDVLARAGDVSMEIAVFPIGWIYSGPFEKLRDG